MKKFNRKIRISLVILLIVLAVFLGFSNAGIIFSANGENVITVSTTKKTFDPNNYVASIGSIPSHIPETTTTIAPTTTTTTTTVVPTTTKTLPQTTWNGDVLTKRKGVVQGPSGRETYYNLNMGGVISAMRRAGYSEQEYPYWIREDGVKMLGNYVMVAASYDIRPIGTILESSLGMAIVCDTGSFAKTNPTQLDIAVSW